MKKDLTDIVERLRDLPRYWGQESLRNMRLEAADEIERLRAPDLLDLAHNVGGLDDHVVTYGDIRTLRDLIIEWRDAARAAIAKAEGK